MKIGIAVQGRFHAFDMAAALIKQGHSVTVMTNYPRWAVARLGLSGEHVISLPLHGIAQRVLNHLGLARVFEAPLHIWFGRWAARQCRARTFDVVHVFSGVAEEAFRLLGDTGTLLTLARCSTHIRTQAQLLEEEELRVGHRLEKPTKWMLAREGREYALAEAILTLSSFSRDSFLAHGVSSDRLPLLVSAVSTRQFQVPAVTVAERRRRIATGAPLRILTVGTFSYRKGIFDLAAIAWELPSSKFKFRFVGAIAPEAAKLALALKERIEFVPKQRQGDLPAQYAWGDVFLFPTIEDGFPAVLAQAAASGLPILTTPNGAGADLVQEGKTGWVLPVRSPSSFIAQLRQCEVERQSTAAMTDFIYRHYMSRDFSDMAVDFAHIAERLISLKKARSPQGSSGQAQTTRQPATTQRTCVAQGKIAIVVQGRFFAFDLARELAKRGQDFCLLTNYPKSVVSRFGVPRRFVRNNLIHGLTSRLADAVSRGRDRIVIEPQLHRWFSRWSAGLLARYPFDIVLGFSGVCEELFEAEASKQSVKLLVRGSSHIQEQFEILSAEEKRTGYKTYKPSRWMVDRELREYQAADRIIVLSEFARESFVRHGIDEGKLRVLPLGTEKRAFRPSPTEVTMRSDRIRSGAKLRVLTIGTFSWRKGAFDLVEIARRTQDIAQFRFVGSISPRATLLARRAIDLIDFIPRVSEFDLPTCYNWGDVFLFPTLEDGYAAVLSQAVAAGLPIMASVNCGAPGLIDEGYNGWLFPIRRPELFVERLRWCDQNRGELASIAEKVYEYYTPRDWSDVADDFVRICQEARQELL